MFYAQAIRPEASFFVKLGNLGHALSTMMTQTAFFGLGPQLQSSLQVDFEIGCILAWYGPIGLLGYAVLFGGLFRSLKAAGEPLEFKVALGAMLVGFLALAFSQGSYLNIRVFPITLALLAAYTARSTEPTELIAVPTAGNADTHV